MISLRVDLPEPDLPTMPTVWPLRTVKLTSWHCQRELDRVFHAPRQRILRSLISLHFSGAIETAPRPLEVTRTFL